MRASGSGRRPIATLIFGSKHSTLLGWIRCPHSPAPIPPITMASNGPFLKQQPEDLWRLSGLDVTDEIVWLPLLEAVSIDAPGWIASDNFFHLLASTPYSVRLQRYCDQAVPLGTDSCSAM